MLARLYRTLVALLLAWHPHPKPTTTTTTVPPHTAPIVVSRDRPTTTLAAEVFAPVAPQPVELHWDRLRQCESGGDYANRRNPRFRGAYQAGFSTWAGVWRRHGRPDLATVDPADASPADQDTFAALLYAERGRQPWPTCGRRL